ncbi:GTPase Der [compost metagenome]
MMAAVERQQPPLAGRFRPKLRYAHQGGINPPRIIVHGNSLERLPESYKRYLEGFFRDKFGLTGTPMRVEFRAGRNPYAKSRSSRA